MSTPAAAEAEYVVICGVSPEAYQRIDALLCEFHTRHAYDGNALEMRRILSGVPPETYWQFIETLPDHYLRHSYDGWTLEMMTPYRSHEWIKGLIGRMLEAMALTLDIPVQTTGSTNLSTAAHDNALQPDESYYFGEKVSSRGQETYRPGEDPPPDLAIEVEITAPVVRRLPLYARIGVREIWHFKNEEMEFLCLAAGGQYERVQRSVAFPFIAVEDVSRFLRQRHDTGENAIVRAFVQWAQQRAKEA